MAIKEVKIPLTNMTFHPDVPSAALGANEYNSTNSSNVETDVRGIRSVCGEQEILSQVSGTPVYVSGGYRDDDEWYYVVGTTAGQYWSIQGNAAPVNITPGATYNANITLNGYSSNVNITDGWNGTTLFINDGVNAPMFWSGTANTMVIYSQYGDEYKDIDNTGNAIVGNGTVATANFYTAETVQIPFNLGEQINITGTANIANSVVISNEFDGNGLPVISGNLANVTFASSCANTVTPAAGKIYPTYEWNYTPTYKKLVAGFMRVYNSPNVGPILIAGNLTATMMDDTVEHFPNTIRWSQAFPTANQAPTTWRPSLSNVANELEIPVRGPALDGFNFNGNFYVMSYWDTVVFSPINYQTTTIPILGVRLLNQGRGLLNSNCYANADNAVYGVDARDFWRFDGQNFVGIGNQRIKEYFYKNVNPDYYDRVFVENNTAKNQIEYYYPDLNSTGWCNQMLSYRYDLDIWNPPRSISNASYAAEAPIWDLLPGNVYGFDNSLRCISYVRGVADSKIMQKDIGFQVLANAASNASTLTNITSTFQRDNIKLLPNYSEQLLVHRVLGEVNSIDDFGLQTTSSGNVTITVGGADSVGQAVTFKNPVEQPINTGNPWIQVNQNAFRVNSIKIEHTTSNTQGVIITGSTWQFAQTQDAV